MNSNELFSFRNSIAADCLLLPEIALRASKRAKLRRAGFGPKARKVPFCRDSYNFFLGELSVYTRSRKRQSPHPVALINPISAFVHILPTHCKMVTRSILSN